MPGANNSRCKTEVSESVQVSPASAFRPYLAMFADKYLLLMRYATIVAYIIILAPLMWSISRRMNYGLLLLCLGAFIWIFARILEPHLEAIGLTEGVVWAGIAVNGSGLIWIAGWLLARSR
jgi:hypothetical protein